jgi:hypothetical protein
LRCVYVERKKERENTHTHTYTLFFRIERFATRERENE